MACLTISASFFVFDFKASKTLKSMMVTHFQLFWWPGLQISYFASLFSSWAPMGSKGGPGGAQGSPREPKRGPGGGRRDSKGIQGRPRGTQKGSRKTQKVSRGSPGGPKAGHGGGKAAGNWIIFVKPDFKERVFQGVLYVFHNRLSNIQRFFYTHESALRVSRR